MSKCLCITRCDECLQEKTGVAIKILDSSKSDESRAKIKSYLLVSYALPNLCIYHHPLPMFVNYKILPMFSIA